MRSARAPIAVRRRSAPPHGAPGWMVTFSDMMALLLSFFILLQTFSELRQEHEYRRVVTGIQAAFGYAGEIAAMPLDGPALAALVETMERMALRRDDESGQMSRNLEPGMDGPHVRVTRVREGIVFTIGGATTFDAFSAEVKPAARTELAKVAALARGRTNRIEVVGHAAAKYLPPGSQWRSLDELSYRRAENVKAVLESLGIDDRVFRLRAAGMREPLRPRASGLDASAENRRVEIILTEVLVDETSAAAISDGGLSARGG